jgi:hypothetical protein
MLNNWLFIFSQPLQYNTDLQSSLVSRSTMQVSLNLQRMPWYYVTGNQARVMGHHRLQRLIHASDFMDGHILPHTTHDPCSKPKPSTQHSPARGQDTSKTSGQMRQTETRNRGIQ